MKISILGVALLTIVLSGCSSSPKPDGTCATAAYGVCLLTWQGGKKVPSGEVDVRYAGLVGGASGEFSGSTEVVGIKQW